MVTLPASSPSGRWSCAPLRPATALPFDTHLAVWDPDLFLEDVAASGSDIVTTNIEACPNAFRFVRRAKELGMKVGFALNPATPICQVERLLDELDVVQLMTVDAGFAGQPFVPQVLPKIRELRELAWERGLKAGHRGGRPHQPADHSGRCAGGSQCAGAGKLLWTAG